jgi:peptidyl-prolyl cis-trans isomerase B (cyclophilin B)
LIPQSIGTEFLCVTWRFSWTIFPQMKNLFLTALAVLAIGYSSVAADAEKKNEKAAASGANTNEVAVIKTTVGEMVVGFWPDVAPKTVENFKKLARQKFYDGTAFHRIVKGFMIQGGDPLTKDPTAEMRWGTGDPGYKIDAEFNKRIHERGVLSMARSRDPNSAGSQFFVCLDRAPHLDGSYTGFGKLIKGEDVLMKIGETPVIASASGEPSKPTTRIGVESIRIVPASSIK